MVKIQRKKGKVEKDGPGEPKYPYTVAPKTLRSFLEQVPKKPKPPKITSSTLKTWGYKSGNDASILRVLKDINLLSSSGEPTQGYADYMKTGTGAVVLGKLIKSCYEALFQNVTNPEKASNDELRNFFNINSGGSERTIQLQVDTFKALSAYAIFGETDPLNPDDSSLDSEGSIREVSSFPIIRIDLHIHLPENKTKGDYDSIIESIANHLYGKRK
jgi:hypothetical protein